MNESNSKQIAGRMDTRFWILDAGCWILAVGCGVLSVEGNGDFVITIPIALPSGELISI
jgi:hypothetical protein